MLQSDMLLPGGFGGMPPQKKFLKWCNLVRFVVYFDQVLSFKNFKNFHFLYKNLINQYIRYTKYYSRKKRGILVFFLK